MRQQSFTNKSERLRKYLVKIYYQKSQYFTVFGSDIQEQEVDKLLVNSQKQIMLFSDKKNLIQFLGQSETLFDQENFSQWKSFLTVDSKPYNEVNFDSLLLLKNEHKNLESIFVALGLLEDFAIQTQEEVLLNYFSKKIIKKFKEDASGLFIWSRQTTIEMGTDLSKDLKEVYERLAFLTFRT